MTCLMDGYIYTYTYIFMVCGCIWSALFLEMFTFRALFSVIPWATVVPRKALEISLFLFWIKMVQWQTKSTGWMWPIAPWLCGWCGNCGLSFYTYIYIYQYMHIYILFTTSSVCFFSSDSSLSWRIRVFKYPVSSHISLRKYSRTPLWYQDIHPRFAFVWEYSIPIPILNPLVNHRLSSGRCPISRQIGIFRFRFHPVLDPWVSMSIPLCPGMIDRYLQRLN
jgi:hypothetical protein